MDFPFKYQIKLGMEKNPGFHDEKYLYLKVNVDCPELLSLFNYRIITRSTHTHSICLFQGYLPLSPRLYFASPPF
jgi:hypothetical protein